MPESTEDIQDIDQLVAQADTLVADLESVTAAAIQSASDEGPTIEPPEWVPPVESESSKVEAQADSTSDATEPAAEQTDKPADESPAELGDKPAVEPPAEPAADASATSADETSDATSQAGDQVGKVASQADAADATDHPDPVSSQPSASDEKGDDAEVDLTSSPASESSPDPATDSAPDSGTESTPQGSAKSAQAESQESAEPAVARDDASQPSADSPAQAPAASSAEPVDPIASSESESGQAIRLDDPPSDPPETLSQDEPDTAPDGAQEPICEIESDESEHEPSGDILMDDAPQVAQDEKHELLADACAGPIEDTAEASERVRSLDDELARLADEMIEGEGDDADASVLMNATSEDDEDSPKDEEPDQGEQGQTSPREAATAHSTATDQAGTSDTPDASKSAQATATTARQPEARRPAAIKDRVWFYIKIAARRTVEIARERGPVIAAQIEPIARATCERASRPLDKKKPIVRKTMGWVAVSTAVYASLVLFYVAFVRKPTVIEPDQPGTTLIDDTGRPIASHPDGS